jgi:hypothetical protein
MRRIILAAVLALGVGVVPAAAKPAHPSHPQHPSQSHKCTPHAVAYTVGGTLVSGSLTSDGRNTYSGTLVVHVTKANHQARADKGTDKSYALAHAKIQLGHGETAAAPLVNSRVKLNGKVTTLGKKCDQTGFSPTITIRNGSIKAPKAPH